MLYQLSLLIIITIFYIAYFTKQILLRKNGITANQLAKGQKPTGTRRIEALLIIGSYGTAILQYAGLFFSQYMLPFSLPAGIGVVGLILAACGVAIFIAAIITMRDSWRAGVDESQQTALVAEGVYRISRNPAFVGFDLLYIGTILVIPNMVLLVCGGLTILLFHLQILEEEKYLTKTFDQPYMLYKKKTPRYLFF